MPIDEDTTRLRHMLDFARKAVEFSKGRPRDDVHTNEQLALSLRKLMEDIGEASKRVSLAFRERHAEIPWRGLAQTRDRLIHGYSNIDYDIIWGIVTRRMPEVVAALERILGPAEGE